MPCFEYECSVSGEKFEVIRKVGEDKIDCPVCGGISWKLISKSSFVLAGDGWAKDNYKGAEKC